LKHLPDTNLNAAIGITALAMLYIIRAFFNYMARKQPQRRKLYFFINTLRTAFVLLLYILISYLMNRNHRSRPRISILGTVPRGFKHMGAPAINKEIISSFAEDIPVSVIVLLIEHIAISKSFGRVNNYRIDPSQELVAIGITNIFAPFFGGYPSTGSFSRTAIKSKAGVRTPFAGVITGLLVLLALYALPAMFFYIPNAALAAVIIHAVLDLITPPAEVYSFWRVNPLEVVIFFVGVFVTIFSSIENGIYCTVGLAGGLMLWRIAKVSQDLSEPRMHPDNVCYQPAGAFLGRIRVTINTTGEERRLVVFQ
jgi:sodium-independent sulfate anion transporter 11